MTTKALAFFLHALDELDSAVEAYQSLSILSQNADNDFSHVGVVMRNLNAHLASLAEILRDMAHQADWPDSLPATFVGRC